MFSNRVLKRRITFVVALALPVVLYGALTERASWLPIMQQVHQGEVTALAFSTDGKHLASAGGDNSFRLFDARTLHSLKPLYGPKNGWAIAFAPDLKMIASGHDIYDSPIVETYPRIALYDSATGHPLSNLPLTVSASIVRFSPQGDYLACGARVDGPTPAGNVCGDWTLWRVHEHELQGPLLHNYDHVDSIAFAPNDKIVGTGLWDGTIKLWSLTSRKLLRVLQVTPIKTQGLIGISDSNAVLAVAFSPNGKLLASGHADDSIRLWNLTSGQLIRTWRGNSVPVQEIAFSPDGDTLASSDRLMLPPKRGTEGAIKLWNVQTGQEVRSLKTRHSGVTKIAFAPDGSTLASGYQDGTIALWRIK